MGNIYPERNQFRIDWYWVVVAGWTSVLSRVLAYGAWGVCNCKQEAPEREETVAVKWLLSALIDAPSAPSRGVGRRMSNYFTELYPLDLWDEGPRFCVVHLYGGPAR